ERRAALEGQVLLLSSSVFAPCFLRGCVGSCALQVRPADRLTYAREWYLFERMGCSRPSIKDFRRKRKVLTMAGAELGGKGLPKQGPFPGMRCSEHFNQERRPYAAIYGPARGGGKGDGRGRRVGAAAHAGRRAAAAVRGGAADARSRLRPG